MKIVKVKTKFSLKQKNLKSESLNTILALKYFAMKIFSFELNNT